MTILAFILICCAIGVGFYGVSRIQDIPARRIAFGVMIVITICFLLVAAGVIGSAPLHLR